MNKFEAVATFWIAPFEEGFQSAKLAANVVLPIYAEMYPGAELATIRREDKLHLGFLVESSSN